MITRGETFKDIKFGTYLEVLRVSKNQEWADLEVTEPASGAHWRKRQPLKDGAFMFPVIPLQDAPDWTI